MSKLFTYLNVKEDDLQLIDDETKQMAQVVEMMQGAYKTAPEGRKKEVLANMISETVALILARLNAIEGLSKDAKKKVEEENKELPKERNVPKYEPQKEQKQEPRKEEPRKQDESKKDKYPFKVGEKWLSRLSNIVFEIMAIYEEDGEILVKNVEEGGKGKLSIDTVLDRIEEGSWTKIIDEEKEEPKKEEPKEQEEELSQEEIKEAINGLKILARMGDEEAKEELKRLKALLKK